jgi:hypothetical protein
MSLLFIYTSRLNHSTFFLNLNKIVSSVPDLKESLACHWETPAKRKQHFYQVIMGKREHIVPGGQ